MILNIITLLGAIGLFLYGMNMMFNGLMKYSDKAMKRFRFMVTSNKINGILGGFGLTSMILSSRKTTVVIVSLVNAGILTLAQAVPAIMGANIGTTLTAWLITVLMFSMKFTVYAYILMAAGFVLNSSKVKKRKEIGQLIIGIALIFIGLSFIQSTFGTICDTSSLDTAMTSLTSHGFGSVLAFTLIGMLLALIFQSSCAAISVTLIILAAGIIPFGIGVAMVIGANIGTTFTTTLVALKGNFQARRAALIHLLFNVITAVILLIFFNPFTRLAGSIVSLSGGSADSPSGTAPLFGLCVSHTLFNLIGTILLVGFSNIFVKVVTALVKEEKAPANRYRLKYIGGGAFGTPALSISQAFNEIVNFGEVCLEDFGYIKSAINEKDADKFEEERKKLVEYEELTDRMQFEIADFLGKLDNDELTEGQNGEIRVIYRVIGELESLGDSGENISRLLERLRIHGITFGDDVMEKVNVMLGKTERAYIAMVDNLRIASTVGLKDISNAYAAENDINITRDNMREEAVNDMDNTNANYQSISYFLDLISELEAMGDFMINISQALVITDE